MTTSYHTYGSHLVVCEAHLAKAVFTVLTTVQLGDNAATAAVATA